MGKQDGDDIIDILVILDRSGSMAGGKDDHEGGLRSFVRDQQSLAGDVLFTLAQFDSHDPCQIVFDRTPIADVKPDKIDLVPRGGTPLYAAVGAALAHMQARQAKAPSGQTVAMIITDGQDTGPNGEWTKAAVQERRRDLERAGWTFLFLAANMDAFGEAAQVGVGSAYAMNYAAAAGVSAAASTRAMYGTISNKMAAARSMRSAGASGTMSASALAFTPADSANVSSGSNVTFDGGAATLADLQDSGQYNTDNAASEPANDGAKKGGK